MFYPNNMEMLLFRLFSELALVSVCFKMSTTSLGKCDFNLTANITAWSGFWIFKCHSETDICLINSHCEEKTTRLVLEWNLLGVRKFLKYYNFWFSYMQKKKNISVHENYSVYIRKCQNLTMGRVFPDSHTHTCLFDG